MADAGATTTWRLRGLELPLALAGLEVYALERRSQLEPRSRELVRFHRTRPPDSESNLLFG